MKICRLLGNLYAHIIANFDRFISIFSKIALIFLGVLIVFTVSPSQTAVTSLPMMSGRNSLDLNSLDYQVWGNARVLSQAATEAKISC